MLFYHGLSPRYCERVVVHLLLTTILFFILTDMGGAGKYFRSRWLSCNVAPTDFCLFLRELRSHAC